MKWIFRCPLDDIISHLDIIIYHLNQDIDLLPVGPEDKNAVFEMCSLNLPNNFNASPGFGQQRDTIVGIVLHLKALYHRLKSYADHPSQIL